MNDWKCNCGEMNFKIRTSCRKCGKNKFQSMKNGNTKIVGTWGTNRGDWICKIQGCGEKNFAKRVFCRKCGLIQDLNDPKETEGLCVVCLDKKSIYASKKCGHKCLCEDCYPKLTQCPLCSAKYDPISDILKIYL
jgi:hypothetical protein